MNALLDRQGHLASTYAEELEATLRHIGRDRVSQSASAFHRLLHGGKAHARARCCLGADPLFYREHDPLKVAMVIIAVPRPRATRVGMAGTGSRTTTAISAPKAASSAGSS
jgi:hypothetical protein